MERYKRKFESVEIPLEKNDVFLYGKFKNKRAIFDHSYINDKGDTIIVTDTGKEIVASRVRIIKEDYQNFDKKSYLKWKRKNVTIRGMKDIGKENGGMGRFGVGIYTAFLGNREMAREYGKIYFVVGAIPKHPKIVDNTNYAQMWFQDLVNNFCKSKGKPYNIQYFHKHTSYKKEMLKLGFDGFVIKGREMVNYTPDESKIRYFENEDQLIQYYESIILKEDLHLKDFTKHSGASDFTKDWIEIRRKIVGAGNKSSKLHSIKVNRKKDYIIFIFKSKPTYDTVADSVDVNSFAKGKKVRKYTQRIMVLDFFKYLETKPNYEDANVTWKEIKECLDVCPIKVDCNCMAQTFQGLSYYLTQLDGSIVPNNIKPRVWNKYHDVNGDTGFLCKHLSMIFNSVSFFKTNFTSMINKYLKQKKN